jgi:hypothetical protein
MVTDIAEGDFNGDGIPDLAVVSNENMGNCGVAWQSWASRLLGNGDGTFTVPTSVFTGATYLAALDNGGNTVTVLLNESGPVPESYPVNLALPGSHQLEAVLQRISACTQREIDATRQALVLFGENSPMRPLKTALVLLNRHQFGQTRVNAKPCLRLRHLD